jgi:hypothetical protein
MKISSTNACPYDGENGSELVEAALTGNLELLGLLLSAQSPVDLVTGDFFSYATD